MPIPFVKSASGHCLACLLVLLISLSSFQSSAQTSISGTVFNDANGLTDNTVNGTPSGMGGLNIVLYDNTLLQVANVVAVAPNGTYSFANVTAGDEYALYISNSPVTVGQAAPPSLLLPGGWALAGENLGTGAGSDGAVDGMLYVGFVSSSVSDADFGTLEICSGGTIYGLSSTGQIRAFLSPATSGAMGPLVNSATYGAGANSNSLAYNPVNGKFYYFFIKLGGSQTFVSYDPSTNSYATLSLTGYSGTETVRGAITPDGTGFYTINVNGGLEYYDIAANTWTFITSTYLDQSGNNISSQVAGASSGDVVIDGSGNLWLLTGTSLSSTYTLYKINAPLPTASVANITAKIVSTGALGTQPNGIAFSASGEIYLTNSTPNTISRLNNNLTITNIGTLSGGSSIDLASCAFPLNPLSDLDYGDAPSSYKTSQSDDGPRHSPSFYNVTTNTSSLMIGSKIDIEPSAAPTVNADGDDAAGVDDEDGVTYFPVLPVNATSYSLKVKVTNTTGLTAYLKGWIDFNRNGVFDASEGAIVSIPNGATSATLNWTGLSSLSIGTTYSRFRIATVAAEVANPTGDAADGEVEDYRLLVIGYKISGNVFEDLNGLADNTVNGFGTNAGGTLNAILYDNTINEVAAITDVNPDGTYSFGAAPGDTYTVYVTVNTASVGDASPPVVVLGGFLTNTGENLGAGPGSDGTPDGILSIGVVNADVTNANFGVVTSVLPVKLISFSAVPKDGIVKLNWATESEIGTEWFIIEQSIDGKTWTAKGQVKASGSSVSNLNYNWVDNKPFDGASYYRLRMIDADNKYEFSRTVAVNLAAAVNLKSYPNPAISEINIELPVIVETAKLQLTGADGKLVKVITVNQSNRIRMNVDGLSKGIYYITINLDNKTYTTRFSKM
jgi:hypothetical protein